jgi:hypothetical protein
MDNSPSDRPSVLPEMASECTSPQRIKERGDGVALRKETSARKQTQKLVEPGT